jgi:hypothetical protein
MGNKIFISLLAVLVLLTGCRKFEELNTDPAKPQETEPRYLLANAEKRASDLMYHGYYNGRIGMQFAQYWTGTDKTDESRNLLGDDGLWAALYMGPLMDLQGIEAYYSRHPEEYNESMLAASRILKAWIFHVLTDLYTDIPYTQALQVETYPLPVFDHGEEVYAALLNSLSDQVNVLQTNSPGLITGDILGNGNKAYWIRFANALRMRIALRMADVKPAEAGRIIEEAAGYTLSNVGEDVYFPYNNISATNRFPYNEADKPIVEFAMTTTLINYLKATGDPRLEVYARPDANTSRYRGKPYGYADNKPLIDSLSKPGELMYSAGAKGYIITYAEVAFIKAEAAARGMNMGGSPEALYEEAVRASMQQWNITDNNFAISAYLMDVPYKAGNWRNVIGSQKWIALYTQGLQSWMERLRLDFKKPDGTALFIAPVSGSLDPEVADVPQRLNYPNATRNSNAANVEAAVQHIGKDSKATKNWWNIH